MAKKNTVVVDVDPFLAEVGAESKAFSMYGKTWTLAPEMPALAMLKWQAAEAQGDAGLGVQVDTLRVILQPASQVDELLEEGAGALALAAILSVALAVYSGEDPAKALAELKKDDEEDDPKGE